MERRWHGMARLLVRPTDAVGQTGGYRLMRIRVLGPLTLFHENRSATPTAPKPRSVLAVLLLQANQAVPVAMLARELWGEAPPASYRTTLQTYVLHLRKVLGAALGVPIAEIARTVLVTTPSGYLFHTERDDFDLPAFEQLAMAGRRALAIGDNAAAAELLVRALGLWRGPTLAGLAAGRVLRPQVKRLEEVRLVTAEQSVEARLRLGRHHEVLSELSELLTEYRLNESLHAQFMVALHRSGRRQDALRVFQQLRSTMREELGLEPSKRLHQVQQAILADDPALRVAPRTDGLVQLLDQLAPAS
jgi:DNA-binding SARP family transcriptional activator